MARAEDYTHTTASKRLWLWAALAFFLISQGIGLFLRSQVLWPQPVNYKYILYAHTHVILSGWVYAALFILIVQIFLPPAIQAKPSWRHHYWLTQLGVLGMLFSFPFQGYKLYSIAASTLVILLSYAFAIRVWRQRAPDVNGTLAFFCLKLSFIWMAIASIGPWSLGPLMVKMPGSPIYHLAVYFYLHFHYNGFFTFAILALAIAWLMDQGLPITVGLKRGVYWLAGAVIPAYALSTLWLAPPIWVYLLAGGAALMQWVALGYFMAYGLQQKQALSQALQTQSSPWIGGLFSCAGLALIFKWGMQFLSAFPYFAEMAYRLVPYLVIGYLHLVFLGFVTCFLLGALAWQKLLNLQHPLTGWGLLLFLLGVGLSEGLLFVQGASRWWELGSITGYPLGLFLASALMPLGLLGVLLGQIVLPSSKSCH